MILKPRSRWKQSFAKNRKAVVSWTIGCIAYVRWVVPCRTGGNGLQQIQYTFPTEKILGNKFLIVDSAFNIQKYKKMLFQNKSEQVVKRKNG